MRRPVQLVWSKEFENRSEASKEEWRIKKLKREGKIKLYIPPSLSSEPLHDPL
jgi:predicted GIY-YIG superfamily endonuclease